MMPQFIRLLPFVFTGILFALFSPVDTNPPRGGPRSPFLYAGGSDQLHPPPGVVNTASDIQGLLNHFIEAFWNALRSIYAISTTSNREGPRGARELTHVDYRAVLWASARAQGWAGLDSISQRTLSDIGNMSTPQGGTILRQEEETYVRRLISRVLLEVFSSFNVHAIFSPGLYDTTSSDFARTGDPTFFSILDDGGMFFVAATIGNAAHLATALVHLIDEDVMVAEAFHNFATNPSSWTRYTQSTPRFLSVEAIVRTVHRSQRQSSPTLPIIPNPRESFAFASPAPVDIDVEAAAGPFALYDEDIQYIAALFIVAIIRFHRHDGIYYGL